MKTCVGLDIQVEIAFIEKNPKITPEFLQNHIVTEVAISSLTTLNNAISFPCSAEYVPKAGKTGEIVKKKKSFPKYEHFKCAAAVKR